jgi:poly(3-hydroxybutyrate) depolymerase
MKTQVTRHIFACAATAVLSAVVLTMPLHAQRGGRGQAPAPVPPPGPGSIEEIAPPGNNYDIAEFRFWAPPDAGPLQAIAVLVPGSNGDGRAAADDSVWQSFARSHHVALVACHFKDKQHAQGYIEAYANVSQGSGQALLDAVDKFAARSKHPELATAPFLLWGMSAGGQFNYEFTAWKPGRVAAFVVNKGGIYYSALLSPEARAVPGILFIGGKDLQSRIWTISGLFALNRRGGALWALAEEPGAAHIVGQSRDVALAFFDDILPMRIGPNGSLKPIPEKTGFMGDLTARTFTAIGDSKVPTEPNSWLPTDRVARAWQTMETSKP